MSSEAPRQPADSDGQNPAHDPGDQQAQQAAPQRVSRRTWLALALLSAASIAGIASYESSLDTQNNPDQEPSPSDLYILSEERNKRIEEIAATFGRRIVDYAQDNRDNPERSTIFTPDWNFDLRGSGSLQHSYSNPDSRKGFVLSVNVIQHGDYFTYDDVDPSVSILVDGPYDAGEPFRNAHLSKFKGLPDEAKGTWSVSSVVSATTSSPLVDASDFMEAKSAPPEQLRRTEDEVFQTFGQLLRQGGVPE